MNKFYVIFPAVLLIAFAVYYTQIAKPEMADQDRRAAQKVADQQVVDEARRKEIEAKAQVDAQEQQKARELKDHEKQEKARLDREEQDRQIATETAKFESEATSLSKQIADMEKQIVDLRNKREDLSREVFDAAAKVELAKIERRDAELEIQRMYAKVAQTVKDSFLTKLPDATPPK
jgi:DNA polymerase II small subunit/DNA polymerase delta subunit B